MVVPRKYLYGLAIRDYYYSELEVVGSLRVCREQPVVDAPGRSAERAPLQASRLVFVGIDALLAPMGAGVGGL